MVEQFQGNQTGCLRETPAHHYSGLVAMVEKKHLKAIGGKPQ